MFDRGDQRRRAMLGKVHIAKKSLNLNEDDYRAIVYRHITGLDPLKATNEALAAASARDATEPQLLKIIGHFEQLGFKSVAKVVPGRKALAVDTPSARKARALWLSLHQLGAVRNPSEHALEAFACRQLKCEVWRWSDQALSYRLIEALKAMAKRHGWDVGDGRTTKVQGSKQRLLRAILTKLVAAGVASANWSVTDALFRLTGEEIRDIDLVVSREEATRAAQLLGRVLADRSPTVSPEA